MNIANRRRWVRRNRLNAAESLEPRLVLTGAPIINEFAASNSTVLLDEDGDGSDWFEVYNPTTEVIDLEGWYATDDGDRLQQWEFPEVSLAPGGFLVVFASNKDRAIPGRELHTNFSLAASGESLLLVEPDGATIASEFNPYPTQREDITYGRSQSIDELLPAGIDAKYWVPSSDDAGIETNWTTSAFDDTAWETGPTGLGFNLLEPGIGVRHVDVSGGDDGTIGSVTEALKVLSGDFPAGDYDIDVDLQGGVHDLDFGGDLGTFSASTNSYLRPNSTAHFIVEANAAVTIPPGPWTIALGSDEGGLLRLDDAVFFGEANTRGDTAGDNELRYEAARSFRWTSGQFTVGPGGLTSQFSALMFERSGRDAFEVAIRAGHHDNLVNGEDWTVLSDGALGWRVARPSKSARTDLRASMQDVNATVWLRSEFHVDDPSDFDSLTLQLRYSDGFVAYLNGYEIVRDNAPHNLAWNSTATAERSLMDAPRIASINVSQYLDKLQAGRNVLAVQGLNITASDEDFLLEPALVTSSSDAVERYFREPTPGTANGEGVFGFVADVQASQQRGFFSEPITVELSTVTPDATIRFTTDGSVPTAQNGTVYNGPMTISATTTLRVAAFKDGFDPSVDETHSYVFLEDVLEQDRRPPSTFPSRTVNGQTFNYGMDPQIVDDPTWGAQMLSALTALPSISIVTDSDNLFDARRGIYVNAGNRGSSWERPASIELIDPVAGSQFQIDAGLRIRGGFSRSGNNPKHAFRAFFRDEYGDKKLAYALFGDEGVDRFDNIDFRTAQNYSWSFQGDGRNTMLREVFSRDTQKAMGRPYTRSRHYHLYLNGQYWGIYMTQERAEASFAESYFGGIKEDYDVVKHSGSGVEATDGNIRAYRRLWSASRAGFESNDAYYRVQGMNPDGTRNPEFERLLDAGNLIDYMITAYFVGDRDGPGSRFTQPRPNNFYGIYDRQNPDGFKWFIHDAEHSLGTGVSDLVNPLTIQHGGFRESNSNYFNPHWLHEKLVDNAEYRRQFADRVYELFENDGALTIANAVARVDARAAAIETAIIAESARWGDSKREPAFDKNNWKSAVDGVRNFIRTRHATVLRQFQRRGWYPDTEQVSFFVDDSFQHGGQVDPNSGIRLRTRETTGETILAANARWKYLDDGSNQRTAWREPGFSHNSWRTGRAELGYGDGDEQTIVSFGTNANNKHVTTYFARSMTVENLSDIAQVTLSLKRDDGAIVYINGQEVVRSNMPAGNIHYRTLASNVIGGADESAFNDFEIDKSVLHEGSNQLAVEIHQISRTSSSDISFDLEVRVATLNDLSADLYFTTDGSDPREIGGGVNPKAVLFDGNEIKLNESTTLSARTFVDGNWSVLSQARFSTNTTAAAGNLAITEINYNPHQAMPEFGDVNTNDTADFEFVELQNIGADDIELGGVKFSEGISFNFADQVLGHGERIVIPRDKDAFVSRYGDAVPLAVGDDGNGNVGVFDGRLRNGGELLRLDDADGKVIQELTYADNEPWSQLPDGDGSSLQIIDVTANANDPYNWRPSGRIGGSPGLAGDGFVREVVINEILTHTDLPAIDVIELKNSTELPIDVSGWYLSDAGGDLRRYQIPNGTVIPGGEYLLLSEDQLGFGFRGQQADNAYLVQSDVKGKPILFSDYVEFGATQNGVTLGRWPDASGDLFPMISQSLGDDNSGPHLADVIISEVQYRPASPAAVAESREFVEVTNRGPSPLNIGSWQLAGAVQFTLPIGASLSVGESVVFVSFDPIESPGEASDFRNIYAVGGNVRLLGPYHDADRPNPDSLRDGGETIILQRPEDIAQLPLGYVLVDRVAYDDVLPWPAARGTGRSLNRRTPIQYGDSASSWQADTPTPGLFRVDHVSGDVNGDQLVDTSDIDELALAIRTKRDSAVFDLNADASVDDGDLQFLVRGILNTRPGDADLDGSVDFSDFLALSANFGRLHTGWSEGNFDTDHLARTEFPDFLLLASNFAFTRAAAPVQSPPNLITGNDGALAATVEGTRDDLFAVELEWADAEELE